MKKIENFGKVIPDARADLYLEKYEVLAEKFADLPDAQLLKVASRGEQWPLGDAKKAVEEGEEPFVAYWKRAMRRLTHKCPPCADDSPTHGELVKAAARYVEQMQAFKRKVEAVSSEKEIYCFCHTLLEETGGSVKGFASRYGTAVSIYRILKAQRDISGMKRRCREQNFPFGERKAPEAEGRKTRFRFEELKTLERGKLPDWRNGMDVTADMWQDRLDFYGVRYGKSMPQQERREVTNMAFEAFNDIALACGIANRDVSFNGQLGLGQGSHGRGGSGNFFDPALGMINLARMSGAGCLAHEWWHALDYFLAGFCGIHSGRLASEEIERCGHMLPESFKKLIGALKEDADGNPTDFARGSAFFDKKFSKERFGYWSSPCEMSARAFACYVKDVLGEKDDYLYARADVYVFEFDDESVCAHPQGEEREIFNSLFDRLFYDLKELGFLRERSDSDDALEEKPVFFSGESGSSIALTVNAEGQYLIVI